MRRATLYLLFLLAYPAYADIACPTSHDSYDEKIINVTEIHVDDEEVAYQIRIPNVHGKSSFLYAELFVGPREDPDIILMLRTHLINDYNETTISALKKTDLSFSVRARYDRCGYEYQTIKS